MERTTKIRALYLLKILYELTDETHPLSTTELIDLLDKRFGIPAYRTTIASDIDQLRQFGFDIRAVKTVQNKYYIRERLVDTVELKQLIDAVKTSALISNKSAEMLVEKLLLLTSKEQACELHRNVCSARIGYDIEQVQSIVDVFNTAIDSCKKVSFSCFRYNVKKEAKPENNSEPVVISPYAVIRRGERFYVVGFSDMHNAIAAFRTDRIYSVPEIMDEAAIPAPEDFDSRDYTALLSADGEQPVEVELICANDTMDEIVDMFGHDVKTYAFDLTSFRIVVKAAPSKAFFGWLFSMEGKVRIQAPKCINEKYGEMVDAAYSAV